MANKLFKLLDNLSKKHFYPSTAILIKEGKIDENWHYHKCQKCSSIFKFNGNDVVHVDKGLYCSGVRNYYIVKCPLSTCNYPNQHYFGYDKLQILGWDKCCTEYE